jgi:hypothetical protein
MGRLAHNLSNLDKKLCQQVDFMQQARDEYERAEKRITDLAATTADIEADITATEEERDDLIARSIPTGTKGNEVQGHSLEVLNKFLDGAIGVVDSTVILRIQEELASIAFKIHECPAASTTPSEFGPDELGTVPATLTARGPAPSALDLLQDQTDQRLTAAYEVTTQDLLQAKATNILSKQALTQASSRTDTANEAEDDPHATTLQEAKAAASAARLAEQEADKANEAAKEALSLFKQHQKPGPYAGK